MYLSGNGGTLTRGPPGRGPAVESASMPEMAKTKVVAVFNRLLEAELAGVVRYTHYSFLVFGSSFGFDGIPIISWLREQASESLLRAQQVGGWITTLRAYPSLVIGRLLDLHEYDITAILKEYLDAEAKGQALYWELLEAIDGGSVALKEFARQIIQTDELHTAEVGKLPAKPGDIATYATRLPNTDSVVGETPSAKIPTGPMRSDFVFPIAATCAPLPDAAPSRCAASPT